MLDSWKNNRYLSEIPRNNLFKQAQDQIFTQKQVYWFKILFAVLIALGVFFRLANIEDKIYWHDEVYTSIRAGGHLIEEIYKTAFNNRIVSVTDLQKFQDIKPGSTTLDTIKSLIQEDPQHPPLYFILARYTLKFFGNSLTSHRILAILFSLLSIPLIYLFALDLFHSKLVASLSAILFSLSPFDVIFAQTDRQYGLLTLATILSSWMLWRSLAQPNLLHWILYTLSCTLGLYTQPFFALTLFSHFCFILYNSFVLLKNKSSLIQFIISIFSTFILYSPWIYIIIKNFNKVLKLTNWVYFNKTIIYFFKLWILSFSSLFTDFFVGLGNPLTYLYRLFFIILIFISFYTLYRQNNVAKFVFILTSSLTPFLVLAIPDLFSGSARSTVARYLIPCFPSIQIAVAYYLSHQLIKNFKIGRLILIFLLTNSIIFCTLITFSETSWAKVPSFYNAEIAKKINEFSSPLIISDRGNNWTNLGELISLSYIVNKDTQFFLTSEPPSQDKLESILKNSSYNLLVFRPSQKLKASIESLSYSLDNLFPIGNLYQILRNYNSN